MVGLVPLRTAAAVASGWAGQRLEATRAELARRNALASQPQPAGVTQPPLRFFWGEFATAAETWRARRALIDRQAQGTARPRPIMLLPGFGAHAMRMRPLRLALAKAGHEVRDWGQGFNLGPSLAKFAAVERAIVAFAEEAGEPVVLIGWSLGGLYARELARRMPDQIAAVITMGSPFSGDLHANRAWRAYQWVTGQEVDQPPFPCDHAAKPPVPTIALWSPRDGVVSVRSARGLAHERDRAIAVRCTHLGFASHPAVAQAVLDVLDRLEETRH